MDDIPEIVDFIELVEKHLKGRKIVSYTSRHLRTFVKNHNSTLLAIDAKRQTKAGSVKDMALVAKLPPISDKKKWKKYLPERSCVTENAAYKNLLPAIKQLQKTIGIEKKLRFNGFAKYYGSRISLNDQATVVDVNAVLVLKNLQAHKYKTGNRYEMFNFDETQQILIQVAKFHALSIAVRNKRPLEFDENIRPFFKRLDLIGGMDEKSYNKFVKQFFEDVGRATNADTSILQRLARLLVELQEVMVSEEKKDDLYTTIGHFALFPDSIMIKYDKNNLPSKVKLIDFQVAQYESVAFDVIFFLFTSVKLEILRNNLQDFLSCYFNAFTIALTSAGIETHEYSFENFQKELRKYGPLAICLCLLVIRPYVSEASAMQENFKGMSKDQLEQKALVIIAERFHDVIHLAQTNELFEKVEHIKII